MTLAPSLVEQRLAVRDQLRVQRQDVAEQLFESKAEGSFPRSITMRVLIRRPDLVGRFVALVAGVCALPYRRAVARRRLIAAHQPTQE